MAFDKAAASGALKEFYLPAICEQFNSRTEYLAQFERNSENVEGLEVVLSLHVGRNQGIGARQELEDLPAPGNQGYTKQRVNLKYNYAQLQISGPLIRAAKTERGSWLKPIESESKGAVTDLRMDVERQLLGTSDGVIAATGVTTAAAAVVTTATTTQIRQIKKGMVIDIGTVANPTAVVQGAVVQSVNTTTKVVTINSAVTTDATHRIFRRGNGGSGANQRELTGLQTIVDSTGTLFGVDPTVYPEWASYELDASSATISDALVEQLIDEVDIASPDGVPNYAVTDHVQARKYAATLTGQRRFVNTLDLKGGFKGIEIGTGSGSLTLSTLRDAPVQTLFALNTDHITQDEASDWEFMDEDGSVLTRIQTGNGKDGYGATLFKYHEQTTDARAAHGKIVNLAA